MNTQTPELVALCRDDEDGEQQVAGWAMVLADRVMCFVPDRVGVGAATYDFESLESADRMLSYAGIYPVADLSTLPAHHAERRGEGGATVPHAIDWTTHQRRS